MSNDMLFFVCSPNQQTIISPETCILTIWSKNDKIQIEVKNETRKSYRNFEKRI